MTHCGPAVFIGSSNTTGGATYWPARLSGVRGWTMHNFAVGGAGYTSAGDSFLQQAQKAVATLTDEQRIETEYFFVGDASNDARANATYETVKSKAAALFKYVREHFPNARIVVLPIIWPADAQRYAPTQFGYDVKWNASAIRVGQAQKDALELYSNALFIDQSWTWLTGRDELMLAANDVHPNDAGHAWIANAVDRALSGETVITTSAWTEVTPLVGWKHGSASWGRTLSVIRHGWDVTIEGAIQATSAFGGPGYADMGNVPYGFRPTYFVPIFANKQGARTPLAVELYSNGTLRIVGSGTTNDGPYLFTSYRIG